MNTKLFHASLSPHYSAYMLKRLVHVDGGPSEGPRGGPVERADTKKETAKKLAALKESISRDPDNVKKIAEAIDMADKEDEVKQAVLRYDLSKYAKRLPAAQEAIISKIKDAIKDGSIKMDDIVFYGGTDFKRFNLKRVLNQSKDWHAKKAQALQEMLALGDRLHPQSAKDTLQYYSGKFGTGEIDMYISAESRGDTKNSVIKNHTEAFLSEGGLFNLALAFQRAKSAHKELGGGKPFDLSKQEVYLDVGKKNTDPSTRKSGIWALGEVKAEEPAPEPVPEPPKREEPKPEPRREEPPVEPKREEPKPEPKIEPPKPVPKLPEVLPTDPEGEKTFVEGMISKDYKIFVQAYQNMTSRNDYNGPGKEQNVFMRDPLMDIKTPALHEVAMGYGVEHGKERDTAKQINRFKVRGVYLKETGIDGERIFLKELENDLRNYYKEIVRKNGIKINKPNAKEQAERDAFTKDFEKYFEERLKEFEVKAGTDLKGKTLNNAMYAGSLFSVTKDPLWSTLVDVRRGPDIGGKPQFEYYIRGAKRIDRADVSSYMKSVALQQYDLDHKFIVLGTPKAKPVPPESIPVGGPGLQETAPNPLDDREIDDETKDDEFKKLNTEAAKLNALALKGTKSIVNDSPKKKTSWEAYLDAEKKILAFTEGKKESPYYTSLLHIAQAEAKLGKLDDAKARLEEVVVFFISHPTAEKALKKKNLAMALTAAILEYEAKK